MPEQNLKQSSHPSAVERPRDVRRRPTGAPRDAVRRRLAPLPPLAEHLDEDDGGFGWDTSKMLDADFDGMDGDPLQEFRRSRRSGNDGWDD